MVERPLNPAYRFIPEEDARHIDYPDGTAALCRMAQVQGRGLCGKGIECRLGSSVVAVTEGKPGFFVSSECAVCDPDNTIVDGAAQLIANEISRPVSEESMTSVPHGLGAVLLAKFSALPGLRKTA